MTPNEYSMHMFLNEVLTRLERLFPKYYLETEGLDRLQRIRFYLDRVEETL